MNSKTLTLVTPRLLLALTLLLFAATAALAQTPVDENGQPLGPVYSDADGSATEDVIPVLNSNELAELVGPIALYPDDLLAIVLPASTYPLEVVQAARYLEDLKQDSSLQPDDEWDDSIVALLNYPEVLAMMSADIDWTWRLGEAVVAQQADVVSAVEQFRDRAYVAGNLKTDERQTVTRNDDEIIEIVPVEDDVIYVPYYEPERVVVYQSRPVYHYYPRAYPVYYYPYPAGYHFANNLFWGVTTSFRIGWASDHLHVYHHSYRGHPYFGWNYYGNYWRRTSISVFNNWYGGVGYDGYANLHDRNRYGSYWRPRRHGGARPGLQPARESYYNGRRRSTSSDGYANRDRRGDRQIDPRDRRRQQSINTRSTSLARQNNATSNNARRSAAVTPRGSNNTDRASLRRDGVNRDARSEIRFRDRGDNQQRVNAGTNSAASAQQRTNANPAVRRNSSANVRTRATNGRRLDQSAARERRAAAERTAAARRNSQPQQTNRNNRVERTAAARSRTATEARARQPQRSAPARVRAAPQVRQARRPTAAPATRPAVNNSSQRRATNPQRSATPRRSAAPKRSAAPQRSRSESPARRSARPAGDRRRQ